MDLKKQIQKLQSELVEANQQSLYQQQQHEQYLQSNNDRMQANYDQQIEESEFDDITLNEKWSPAEVNQILFRNFKDRLNALTELKNLTSEDLYGFELST